MSRHSTAFEVERPVPAGEFVKDLQPGADAEAANVAADFLEAVDRLLAEIDRQFAVVASLPIGHQLVERIGLDSLRLGFAGDCQRPFVTTNGIINSAQ